MMLAHGFAKGKILQKEDLCLIVGFVAPVLDEVFVLPQHNVRAAARGANVFGSSLG